jgi:hypothetical protein
MNIILKYMNHHHSEQPLNIELTICQPKKEKAHAQSKKPPPKLPLSLPQKSCWACLSTAGRPSTDRLVVDWFSLSELLPVLSLHLLAWPKSKCPATRKTTPSTPSKRNNKRLSLSTNTNKPASRSACNFNFAIRYSNNYHLTTLF